MKNMLTTKDRHVVNVSCGMSSEDRAILLEDDRSCLIIVADGVGGLDYGGEAAELITRVGTTAWLESRLNCSSSIKQILKNADLLAFNTNQCGQTTAVMVMVMDGTVFGASVGDSEAWLITDQKHSALTSSQHCRPLLGSGIAEPVTFFRKAPQGGVLLVGSDGLFRRIPAWKACDICRNENAIDACEMLIQLARLPNGRFSDDVSIVVYRLSSPSRTESGRHPGEGKGDIP